jgi:ribonuclease-3
MAPLVQLLKNLKTKMTKPQLKQLEKTIDYTFSNSELLQQSLRHRSFLNEHKDQLLESNERMEFLGDAILELWVSDYIYKKFPQFPEGKLTNLRSLIVCTDNLAKMAQKINLGDYIFLSTGEIKHEGRQNHSILADTFESLLGAIYLEANYDQINKFLSTQLIPNIEILSTQKIYKDPKSIFQEIAQSLRDITPHYEIIKETGPDHQKIFQVGVFISQEQIATGSGHSKQKAEEDASIKATKILNNTV